MDKHHPWGRFHNHGSKYDSYEAGARVPLTVSYPEKVKCGVSDTVFSRIDLFVSLAVLIGKPVSAGAAADSVNYLNTLLGKDKGGRLHIVASGDSLLITVGRRKYVAPNNYNACHSLTRTDLDNHPEERLYNLQEDPTELANVVKDYLDVVVTPKAPLDKEKNK